MGQSSSRRIATFRASTRNNSLSSADDNAPESDFIPEGNDLIHVLQYLVRSGAVHVVPESEDDSDFSSFKPRVPHYGPKYKPNTAVIDKSEFKILTEQTSGVLRKRNIKRNSNNVVSMLLSRETSSKGFSNGERCKINNSHLPTKLKNVVDTYNGKAFIGMFSQSGDRFLSACQDRRIRLYNSSTSEYKRILNIPCDDMGWSVLDAAFSLDGNMIAYSSWSENVYICNVSDGDGERQDALQFGPEGGRFCVFSLAFSHDSSEILGGANDGGLYVYDLDYKKQGLKIKGHDDDVNTVCFADKSSMILYSGGDDGLCKVWDRRTLNENKPKAVGILAGHRDGITFIDPNDDCRHFISNSKDQTIKLWDVRKFSSKAAAKCTSKAVRDQNWDYRRENVPRQLITTRTLLEGDTSVMTYRGHTVLQTLIRSRFSPSFSTGSRYIYTGCAAGRVVIYDVLTGKIESTLNGGHEACVRDVSWHPHRSEIISTSWDHTIVKWSASGKYDNKSAFPKDKDSSQEHKDMLANLGKHPRRSARIAAQRQATRRAELTEAILQRADEDVTSDSSDTNGSTDSQWDDY